MHNMVYYVILVGRHIKMVDNQYRECDNEKCNHVFKLGTAVLKHFEKYENEIFCPKCNSKDHHAITKSYYRKIRGV